MEKKKNYLTGWPCILAFALTANFLWGSAFPGIKAGYALLSVSSSDTAAQLIFAGMRFTLAGFLLLFFLLAASHAKLYPLCSPGASAESGKPESLRKTLLPGRRALVPVIILALFQTAVQYFFFYIGLAHTLGVRGSVIEGTSPFFAILISSLIFRQEHLTPRKLTGILIGFSGIVLINAPALLAASASGGSPAGDIAIMLSTVSAAFSQVFMKEFSKRFDPVLLSAWQFVAGGLMLLMAGILTGGHIGLFPPSAVWLLFYLAFVSAAAYSLWSLLLKYNPVSRVTSFSLLTPVFGVLLSLLILNEQPASPVLLLIALGLVCSGIFIVTRSRT